MTDREIVLNYQAELVLNSFLEIYQKPYPSNLFYEPKLTFNEFDRNGYTDTNKEIISDRSEYRPILDGLSSPYCKFRITDKYYSEIVSLHTHLNGSCSDCHQKHITYVQRQDQELLCELIVKKFREKNINIQACFMDATEKRFLFEKKLGYRYLCLF